jgi:hypothetical protein
VAKFTGCRSYGFRVEHSISACGNWSFEQHATTVYAPSLQNDVFFFESVDSQTFSVFTCMCRSVLLLSPSNLQDVRNSEFLMLHLFTASCMPSPCRPVVKSFDSFIMGG